MDKVLNTTLSTLNFDINVRLRHPYNCGMLWMTHRICFVKNFKLFFYYLSQSDWASKKEYVLRLGHTYSLTCIQLFEPFVHIAVSLATHVRTRAYTCAHTILLQKIHVIVVWVHVKQHFSFCTSFLICLFRCQFKTKYYDSLLLYLSP